MGIEMSLHLESAVRSTILGVVIVMGPVGAEALTVGRCNHLIDGVYKPVLVVKNNDSKTIYQIGENGLTRSVVFNDEAALAWASEKYGSPLAAVQYDDSCTVDARSDPASPVLLTPGDGDCGGSDCGGGDCGGGDCGGGDLGGTRG